jgi:hypothetical protein
VLPPCGFVEGSNISEEYVTSIFKTEEYCGKFFVAAVSTHIYK